MSRVVRVISQIGNQWTLQLACTHTVTIEGKAKPTRTVHPCGVCAGMPEVQPGASLRSRSRLAAARYLDAGGDGRTSGVTLKMCADDQGVTVESVSSAVRRLRDRRLLEGAQATPEDECTL